MQPEKRVTLTKARHRATGLSVSGYEIHLGATSGPDCARAWLEVDGRPEGAASADGRVMGCYLHGLFAADGFRAAFLAMLGQTPDPLDYEAGLEATLDALADHLERHLDLDALFALARPLG
jgi:adenosylcobyric acid synthase